MFVFLDEILLKNQLFSSYYSLMIFIFNYRSVAINVSIVGIQINMNINNNLSVSDKIASTMTKYEHAV